jgi:hypothetical protein
VAPNFPQAQAWRADKSGPQLPNGDTGIADDTAMVKMRLLQYLMMLALAGGLSGCRRSSSPTDPALNLTERIHLVNANAGQILEKHRIVTRNGQEKDCIILVAPMLIQASLHGAEGKKTLEFLAAPVFSIGDGVLLSVYLERAGSRLLAGSRYFDPARKAEDRRWTSVAIPVQVEEGDQLQIEAAAGPQGDLTADWIGLNSVRLAP